MFAEILQEIVEGTAGGVGAVLMGYDGIAIEQYFKPCEGVDLQMMAVEYANVLKEIKRTVEILNTGDMEEVAIKTERFYVVIRALTDEYFTALTLQRDGNFGKGRYLLLRDAQKLIEALS
ncbi:GTPase [Desulfuromonas carbonis]|uniref:roadblock/LC7 domain-containing protein n=1 Tax=Desulfuromonas sp. DDH964 TaxID=1823759 RepID=UPI00078EEA92|nr:roadblock/LC7 domain-containing protein [Desulfuromonas sp. DDH964]AMV71825.1 GTPase-activating protein [Desulfuromonas sp. DDH964]